MLMSAGILMVKTCIIDILPQKSMEVYEKIKRIDAILDFTKVKILMVI